MVPRPPRRPLQADHVLIIIVEHDGAILVLHDHRRLVRLLLGSAGRPGALASAPALLRLLQRPLASGAVLRGHSGLLSRRARDFTLQRVAVRVLLLVPVLLVLHNDLYLKALRKVVYLHDRVCPNAATWQVHQQLGQQAVVERPLVLVQVVALLVAQPRVRPHGGRRHAEVLLEDLGDELPQRGGLGVDGEVELRLAAHGALSVGLLAERRLQQLVVGGMLQEEGGAREVGQRRHQLDGLRGDEARDDGVGGGDRVDDVAGHALGVEE
mmetsp:Transcript_19606/g.50196  ORF Transcript_19606/g.50196 Transcript_19606/m.50196 type:complete len:268 (-) Transcript_19606:1229-2032(-)